MAETQLKDLLEAGVHFGHQTSRWNPKMRQYIYAERNGIHLIDLKKSLQLLGEAQQAVWDVTLQGARVLFVCAKRQLRPIIVHETQRSGSPDETELRLRRRPTNF